MTTHNSFRWSLTDQLKAGIRGFELDIHDEWTRFELWTGRNRFRLKGNFKVGHYFAGNEIRKKLINIRTSTNLETWLGKIRKWSTRNKGHGPITVFLDIKDHLCDSNNDPSDQFGLIRLNEQIKNGCKEKLFTPQNLYDFKEKYETDAWPTIGYLRDSIIVVLMSFYASSAIPPWLKDHSPLEVKDWLTKHGVGLMHTRLKYQNNVKNQVCFVAFNPEDHNKNGYDPSFENDSLFVTAYPPEDYCKFYGNDKIVRTDYKKEDGVWRDFLDCVNFPATDTWQKQHGYEERIKEKGKEWVK